MKKLLTLIVIMFFVMAIAAQEKGNNNYFPWKEVALDNAQMFELEKEIEKVSTRCQVVFNGENGILIYISHINTHQTVAIDSIGTFASERRSGDNIIYPLEMDMVRLNGFHNELNILPEYIQKFLKVFYKELAKEEIYYTW
jgi:hypothetical protein